jgi:hypothetical protein
MNKFFASALSTLVLSFTLAVASCSPAAAGWFDPPVPTSDANMTVDMEALIQQSQRTVGMPSIVNFFERSMVRMLYEIRDNPEFQTHSYIVTMTGEFIKICDSIGYGINASIQFSSPEKVVDAGRYRENGYMTLPQMEPNGLAMPSGLAATYVMCIDPGNPDSGIKAVYVEPEVIVSPFELGG